MLTRKPSSGKKEADWFFFSSGLMVSLCSDYISVRLLCFLEPQTTAFTILPKMLDVAEKALKLYLSVRKKRETALSDARSVYGHNLEKLRVDCSFYEPAFDEPDVREFTKHLNDRDGKLYQALRYGSQETTEGFSASIGKLLPVLDKIFATSLLSLPEPDGMLLVFSSPLKQLLTGTSFDQTRSRNQVLAALERSNAHFRDLVNYCDHLDKEHAALAERLRGLAQTDQD